MLRFRIRLPFFLVTPLLMLFLSTTSPAFAIGCSTSELINAINTAASGDTIALASSCTYTLTAAVSHAGLPDISKSLTINGNGAIIQRSTAGGTASFRLLYHTAGTLTLNNLTLDNGLSGGADGAAIYTNGGTVAISNSTLSNSGTAGGSGGGIYNSNATVTVTGSTISHNGAFNGAGIMNIGASANLTVTNTTIISNVANSGGGGIYNGDTTSATATVTNSTLSGNSGNDGGGIKNLGTVNVRNSTISGNTAYTFNGGGISVGISSSTITLSNSTIADNIAVNNGDNIYSPVGTVKLGSSIVIHSTGSSFPDISGTVSSLGYNVIGNTTGATITGTTTGNLTNAAAFPINLSALANNGGPTQTRALGAGSVAISHGNCATLGGITAVTTDQRGSSRKSPCDVGAYETLPSNLLSNGDFSGGMTGWQTFGNITSRVSSGVFEFYHNTSLGNVRPSILQAISSAFTSADSLELTMDLGNSSSLRKRALVFIVNQDWTDLQTCSFWLEPNAPLRTYVLQGRPTTNWASAQVAIYANPADNTGWMRVDNVNFHKLPGSSIAQTLCTDPTAPAAGSGSDGSNLIVNGGFSAGTTNWITFGNIASRVNSGVFEFYHNTTLGNVRPSVLQNTGTALASRTPVELQLQLGNSGAVRKRALVILFQSDWSDLQMCSFWIPPNTALGTYVMQTYLPTAWSNVSATIYANPADNTGWLRVDNVSLKSRPSLAVTGTNCYEPGSGVGGLSVLAEVLSTESLSATATPETVSPTEEATEMVTEEVTEAITEAAILPAETEVSTQEPTAEVTEAPTLPTTIVDLPTALPFPTLRPPATEMPLPTALPFPTLPPPAAPTELPTSVPLSLPAVATFDEGVSDWLHSENWQLGQHDNGLAWFMTSTTGETLRWQEPIDLRGVQADVALSFQSQFVGDGVATVQISTDAGVTWQPISIMPASDDWTTVSVDLSAYSGSLIEIEFVWQETNAKTTDQWVVDTVVIDTLTPTVVVPSETVMQTATETPTAVNPEVTEAVSPTAPADSNPEPTDLPTSEAASS